MLTLTEAAPGFSDEQLAKARSGDAAALVSLIRAHQRSVYTLALRMLGTRAIDQLRRRSRIEMMPLDDEVPLHSTADDGDPLLQRHLQRLLLELSPPARAVLLLRYQEDLDPIDIARTLDMPINTVKSHLKRSLEILRQRTPNPDRSRCEDQPT